MACFGLHYAHVALRQGNKAPITVALIKTFFGRFVAMDADNIAGVNQAYRFSDQWV
ncbi:hypothetical protein CRENPOLYSF2_1020005 [Crenothrix polyspora]|uniref:Uncharacterized protein n=1 Tax=Crenothrix polyspora TaxID=360316 RepID=A0A1R4GYJ5_9GAMM|nr:hypothetical protein CRENPOLYSF2_1020005 [Crenothrix polyspora]